MWEKRFFCDSVRKKYWIWLHIIKIYIFLCSYRRSTYPWARTENNCKEIIKQKKNRSTLSFSMINLHLLQFCCSKGFSSKRSELVSLSFSQEMRNLACKIYLYCWDNYALISLNNCIIATSIDLKMWRGMKCMNEEMKHS